MPENADRIADILLREDVTFERDVPLRDYTTLRIGGPADFLVEAETGDEVALVLRVARQHGIPIRCIGGGSNLLIDDEGVPGIALVNRIEHMRWEGGVVRVGGGASWDDTVASAVERGMAGVGAMSGIPGSIGGAIYGNAGAYGESVSDRLVSVAVVRPDGSIAERAAKSVSFGYRTSELKQSGEIVIDAAFALEPDDAVRLREQRETILETRAKKHPPHDAPTAGSFFKNIDDVKVRRRLIAQLGLPDNDHRVAAGLLLDRVGARGRIEGDAQVFEGHANIIINRGHATSGDVLRLSGWMRDRVYEAFDIDLEREVIYLSRKPETTGTSTEDA